MLRGEAFLGLPNVLLVTNGLLMRGFTKVSQFACEIVHIQLYTITTVFPQ